MPLFRKRQEDRPASLVAAATEYKVVDQYEAQMLSLTRQAWQARAYGYYHDVGEIRFATRFVGNALSKLQLVAAEVDPDHPEQPKKSENKAVADAVAKLRPGKGGQGNLLRALSHGLFVAGEVFLVGSTKDNKQTWEVLSVRELEARPGMSWQRRTLPGLAPIDLPKDALVVRLWVEDPEFSFLADSAMRGLLGECEKLLLLNRADKAAARSRFAGSGLLFIPNELIPPAQEGSGTQPQGEGPPRENPVQQALIDSMINPIKDESHPSSVVPIVLFGPGEMGDKIRHISFERMADRTSAQKRDDARSAIAAALDLPAEVLTGKYDLNHWTSWLIREETFQSHLQPFVELICDALTIGYLQPALERANVPNPENYLIWYDDSRLIARPNKGESADQGVAELLLSGETWRREHGFTEEDKPDDDEYAKRVGLKVNDPKMAITGKPPEEDPSKLGGVPEEPVQNPRGIAPKEVVKRGQDDNQPAPAKTANPADGAKAPAEKGVTASGAPAVPFARTVSRRLGQLDVDLLNRVRVAGDEVIKQAVSRVGAQIRSRVGAKAPYDDLLRDVNNPLVASVLGPTAVEKIGVDPAVVINSALAEFTKRVEAWMREAQRTRNAELARYLSQRSTPPPAAKPPVRQGQDWDGDIDPDRLEAIYGERDREHRDLAMALLLAALTAVAADALYQQNLGKDVAGEADNLLITPGAVRDALEPTEEGGVATGAVTRDILTDNGIPVPAYEWVYGSAPRVREFEGHRDLDGVQFVNRHDEALAVQPGDEWLDREYYWRGDHRGCQCEIAPVLPDE